MRVFLAAALAVMLAGAAEAEIRASDAAGREVVLQEPARRILIDDGRYLLALSLIHPDPVSLLSAWPGDVHRIGPDLYRRYAERFPAIESLSRVASSAADFSLEQVLAAEPDLAIFSLQSMPSQAEIARLESAGVPVAVIDFFNHPLENLEAGFRLLGQVTGREQEAEAFIAYRREKLDHVRRGVEAAEARPSVFLEPHAARTGECCASPGRGNIGDYIALSGGENIGAEILAGVTGTLNLEYVIAADPDVYIATGGPHQEGTNGLLIGPGYSEGTIHETLDRVLARPGISGLKAVREGRAHGLAHQLLNSPLDILIVEVLAKWFQPERFGDLDPEATLGELNERFLAVPLEGPFWVDAASAD